MSTPFRWLILALILAACSFGCTHEEFQASIDGFVRGATAPVTACTTKYTSKGTNGAYYTTCNTY